MAMALQADQYYSCFNEPFGQHKLFRILGTQEELSALHKLLTGTSTPIKASSFSAKW